MSKICSARRLEALMVLTSGLLWGVTMVFYFILLPLAGSSATHAAFPEQFLPWMVERGGIRVALWIVSALIFLINMIFVPLTLRERLFYGNALFSKISTMVGVLGFFSVVVSALILAAGEMPLARAYVEGSPQLKESILHLYYWQKITTAYIFDFLGFMLLAVWLLSSNLIGLYYKTISRALGGLGIIGSLTAFCFAVGYIIGLGWLGERGIGLISFILIPAWTVLCGISLLRKSR